MPTQWMAFMKNLVKSSLDNYILPGTLTGTEILLLYMAQWKRDLSNVTMVSLYEFFSDADVLPSESIDPNMKNNRE